MLLHWCSTVRETRSVRKPIFSLSILHRRRREYWFTCILARTEEQALTHFSRRLLDGPIAPTLVIITLIGLYRDITARQYRCHYHAMPPCRSSSQSFLLFSNSQMDSQTQDATLYSQWLLTRQDWNDVDSNNMIFDGQASIRWLTGTHEERFVGIDASLVEERERISSNATAMCLLAADRLDDILWFGILEDVPRSMELLRHALNLTYTPSFPRANRRRRAQPKPSEWERQTLTSLMPQDLWLYEYGKRLLEARYSAMETGVFIHPDRPPLPERWSCTSTQTRLDCVEGPLLKGSYDHSRKQIE